MSSLLDSFLVSYYQSQDDAIGSVYDNNTNTVNPDSAVEDSQVGITVVNTTEDSFNDETVGSGHSSDPINPDTLSDENDKIPEPLENSDEGTQEPVYVPQPENPYSTEVYVLRTTGQEFIPEMKGNEIYFPSPVNPAPAINIPHADIQIDSTTVAYTASILNVINNSTVYVDKPYFVHAYDTSPVELGDFIHKYESFDASSFTSSYYGPVEKVTTQNLKSFTKIVLTNLETVSGELNKVRVYSKGRNTGNGAYRVLGESLVTETDGLRFLDINKIPYPANDYMITESYNSVQWETGLDSPPDPYVPTNFVFTSSNQYYFSATKIITDPNVDISSSLFHKIFITSSVNFVKDEVYYAQFKLKSEKSGSLVPFMEVYISGSAFPEPERSVGREFDGELLGQHIQSFFAEKDYRIMRLVFVPQQSGIGFLNFIVRQGIWHIADIRISSLKPRGFSSKTYEFLLPTITEQQDDVLDFKIEFLNPEDTPSETILEIKGVDFSGSNVYINSDRNLIPGSIFIGNVIGEGIEIAGVIGS